MDLNNALCLTTAIACVYNTFSNNLSNIFPTLNTLSTHNVLTKVLCVIKVLLQGDTKGNHLNLGDNFYIKTVFTSRLSYRYDRNPHTPKDGLYIES